MIIDSRHVKAIADKGRALPDEILAPLVIAVVLGAEQPAPQQATPAAVAARTGHRKANSKTRHRIRMVADFVRRTPGLQISQIAAALGLTVNQVRYVIHANMHDIEMRGRPNEARYYAREYVNGAARSQVSQ